MHGTSIARRALLILPALMLSACALMPPSDPVQVTVADIELNRPGN